MKSLLSNVWHFGAKEPQADAGAQAGMAAAVMLLLVSIGTMLVGLEKVKLPELKAAGASVFNLACMGVHMLFFSLCIACSCVNVYVPPGTTEDQKKLILNSDTGKAY